MKREDAMRAVYADLERCVVVTITARSLASSFFRFGWFVIVFLSFLPLRIAEAREL